jgi:hypothetical protein
LTGLLMAVRLWFVSVLQQPSGRCKLRGFCCDK